MKILKVITALIFICFAVLQYNDPDPWLWVLVYGFAAIIIALDISGLAMRRIYRIALLTLILFSIYYIPGVIEFIKRGNYSEIAESMQVKKAYIEETREFFGIIIIILSYIFFYAVSGRNSKVVKQ